jgi:hypothetical protein
VFVQAVGFIAGFIVQRFLVTVVFSIGGFALACLVCLPEWSFLNKNPLPWQPASACEHSNDDNASSSSSDTSARGGGKKRKHN